MHRSIVVLCVLSSCAMSVCDTHAAIIEIYEGVGAGELRSDWEAAVGPLFAEEDFSDGIWQGVTATPNGFGHTGGFGVSGGQFNDRLLAFGLNSTELVFDTPITAFGANWNLTPDGPGLGIAIEVDGELVVQEIPNFFSGQFFGFISDVPFTQIILSAGSQGGFVFTETFSLDNVVSGDTTVVPVPEPSTLLLLCVVTFGLIALRLPRKRRAFGSMRTVASA